MRYLLLFFIKNIVLSIFSDQSTRVAYLGSHTLLYFEHRIFLALDNAFSYYNKDTRKN